MEKAMSVLLNLFLAVVLTTAALVNMVSYQ